MSNILENFNHELVVELYQVKRQLEFADVQLKAQQGSSQKQLFDLKMDLRIAEKQIESQEREIFSLKADIDDLRKENVVLKNQKQELVNYLSRYAARESVSGKLCQEKSNVALEQPQPNQQQSTTSLVDQEIKTTTIAMKLKLCKTPSPVETLPAAKLVEPQSKDQPLRIFVGHLNSETDENTLKEYFIKYGEVADVYFPINSSGQKRGFAFVTFSQFYDKHPLEIPVHLINGCRAYLDFSGYGKNEGERTRTLMASGIIQNASDDDLMKHFSKFGKVIKISRSIESNKKYARWAFITYSDFESVDRALSLLEKHLINGHHLDCRRALNFNLESKNNKDQGILEPHQKTAKPLNVVDVTKLMISNLKPTTTEKKLRKYFSKFGTVHDSYIPTFYGTSNSKGFGYVVMPTKEVNFSLHNHIIDNKAVHISEDNPHHLQFKTTTLLVSAGPQIMVKISEQDLRKFFSRFGKIASVRKPTDPSTHTPSHYAFVEYTSDTPVEKAIENLAYVINGNIVCVTKSRFDPYRK